MKEGIVAQNKSMYQRDIESFKARKNFEEKEARKSNKHHKPRHYELDAEDETEVEDEQSYELE